MSIFRRKPRCPGCGSPEHIDADYHNQEMRKLLAKARPEIRMLNNAASLESVAVTLHTSRWTIEYIKDHQPHVDLGLRKESMQVVMEFVAARGKWEILAVT